jgi:organic hydroperoxide reductase OsmC/OhrA
MSEYKAKIIWETNGESFTYDTYNRTHAITFGSGTEITASSAPDYKGHTDRVNPEEQLLGAISSCHMLTFLAIAAKRSFEVTRYKDEASCWLEKDETGGLSVTRAVLRPQITFADKTPDAETITKMHESAHRNCFIARSLKTKVTIEASS